MSVSAHQTFVSRSFVKKRLKKYIQCFFYYYLKKNKKKNITLFSKYGYSRSMFPEPLRLQKVEVRVLYWFRTIVNLSLDQWIFPVQDYSLQTAHSRQQLPSVWPVPLSIVTGNFAFRLSVSWNAGEPVFHSCHSAHG